MIVHENAGRGGGGLDVAFADLGRQVELVEAAQPGKLGSDG